MNESRPTSEVVRFGVYEVDLRAGELRKRGLKVRLQEKPFQILAALLEHPGEVVTREELRGRLWNAHTFVDFEGSLNAAVNKLREALGDSAENPRFVETLPRRGYRFLASVERSTRAAAAAVGSTAADGASSSLPSYPDSSPAPAERTEAQPEAPLDQRPLRAMSLAIGITAVAALVGFFVINGFNSDADSSLGVPQGRRIMVGVLPFEDFTGEPEQEYFVGGLTEEVVVQLGRLDPQRLGVIGRTSMNAYTSRDRPLDQLGNELGIDYAMEGSVRRENDRVRVSVQMIDVRDKTPIWLEQYDQDLTSILDLQSEIAHLISRSMAVELLDADQRLAAGPTTALPAAYESYLKGRFFREQLTEPGFRKGIEYFEDAIGRDPSYAEAYAGLAGCYCLLGGHGMEIERPRDVLPRAKQAAERALSLHASLAEAHAVIGMIELKYEWNLDEAGRRFKKATELNPSYAQAFLWYSLYHEVMGRYDEAIRLAKRARDLDPLSLGANVNLAQQYHRAGQYDDAIEQLDSALELNPNFWGAHWVLGDSYERKGMYQQAAGSLSRARLQSDPNPAPLGSLGFVYGRSGQNQLALGVLEDLKDLATRRYVSPFNVALIHLGLGQPDQAMEWLEKGYEERSRSMIWLNVDTRLDPLREDPRFQDLIRRIGFN